jgi:hypothetical protein
MQVHLPLVVPSEAHPEDDVVHLLGGDGRAQRLTGERGLDTVQERVHLIDLVAPPERLAPETLTLTRHYVSWFARSLRSLTPPRHARRRRERHY